MSRNIKSRLDDFTGEVIAYSEPAIRNNTMIIEYCRTSSAALSGATAGRSIINVTVAGRISRCHNYSKLKKVIYVQLLVLY